MDQFKIRESVPLEECSCYSGGGDLSVVLLVTSTDVVRSTEQTCPAISKPSGRAAAKAERVVLVAERGKRGWPKTAAVRQKLYFTKF